MRGPAQEWSKASQSFADRVTVALQITLGVEYLHSKRFVHRDLKPANALIAVTSSDERVHVKLCDFGLCRNVDAMAHTASGGAGTCGYQGPSSQTRVSLCNSFPS